jgi:hypothetical protein|tara:strand:+ start:172 stop:330 length:159 start_codon:yes stop_codon:yes gene_type:complete
VPSNGLEFKAITCANVILAMFIFGDVTGARPMTAQCQWCTDSMMELAKAGDG